MNRANNNFPRRVSIKTHQAIESMEFVVFLVMFIGGMIFFTRFINNEWLVIPLFLGLCIAIPLSLRFIIDRLFYLGCNECRGELFENNNAYECFSCDAKLSKEDLNQDRTSDVLPHSSVRDYKHKNIRTIEIGEIVENSIAHRISSQGPVLIALVITSIFWGPFLYSLFVEFQLTSENYIFKYFFFTFMSTPLLVLGYILIRVTKEPEPEKYVLRSSSLSYESGKPSSSRVENYNSGERPQSRADGQPTFHEDVLLTFNKKELKTTFLSQKKDNPGIFVMQKRKQVNISRYANAAEREWLFKEIRNHVGTMPS